MTDLNRFGLLTTTQLQTIHFYEHRSASAAARICRRVLQRLADFRLIERAERRMGGLLGGSDATVWRLGLIGDRLVRQAAGAPRGRFKLPSMRFIDHRLAVADCYVQLVAAHRAGQVELLEATPEPDSWRPFLGAGGAPETLKPDLTLVTASEAFEDYWSLEIDRATESLPTIIAKCQQYERYRRSGREQQRVGVFPVVVWLTPDDRRAGQIERAIRTARSLDPALYRCTAQAGIVDVIRGGAA